MNDENLVMILKPQPFLSNLIVFGLTQADWYQKTSYNVYILK